jgi:hypothetical protein
MYQGTFKANRRSVITSAPDCLVFINGEQSLPSGDNPYRKIPLQPLINSVSVNLSVSGAPGSASLDLHVPQHYLDDIYVGGHLTLTTMMEVQIYMKGQFTVGGTPMFYPVFWGIVTSVDENYSAGEQTVSLACSDILYWWNIQQVNLNPSVLAARADQQARFNLEGNFFTGKNPFSIIYNLSQQVHGNSMNVRNMNFGNRNHRSEPTQTERLRLMAYWTARWGRISNSLRMFGPKGDVLQGDLLDHVVDRSKFQKGKKGKAASYDPKFHKPFKQGDLDLSKVSPFSLNYGNMGAEVLASEFETKLNVANQVSEIIGYEFYMDVTGEIIFKPPFYNMDVRPNYPVSWIRLIDEISSGFAENPPEVTFLEGSGLMKSNKQMSISDDVQPRATYVDYRLVQKYGWKPGSFSSEYVGSDGQGGHMALFYHLVDQMDRQNSRVHTGNVTIPLRPELRLGYPVYVESKDAYYYVEGITHTFSYGSRCQTQLTLMAKRGKFYGDFDRWEAENSEPRPGDLADPGRIPSNMYKRRVDDTSGTPVGDRNVILSYFPEEDLDKYGKIEANSENKDDDAKVVSRNLMNLRSNFGVGGPNKYMYMVDPNRDETSSVTDDGDRVRGPIKHIEADPQIDVDSEGRKIEVNAATFPVSDERGYEVVGTYEYGRRVMVQARGFKYDKDEADVRAEGLVHMQPDDKQGGTTTPNISAQKAQQAPTAHNADPSKDSNFLIDPNNYGRMLTQVSPPEIMSHDLARLATLSAPRLAEEFRGNRPATVSSSTSASTPPPSSGGSGTRATAPSVRSKGGRTFAYNSNVARWRQTIRDVREELDLSEETYPDEAVMAFIHTESSGDARARRTNSDGNLSQFVGLMQIGEANAAETDHENVDFMGDARLSIKHFLQVQDKYSKHHGGDPKKQAILWKGGIGTLKRYNRLERNGYTPQELENWLSTYPKGKSPWGVDNYVYHHEAAQEMWSNSIVEAPPDGEVPEDGGVKESVKVVDEADDPVASQMVNTTGIPNTQVETEAQVELFRERLEANREGGIHALPANVKPPRDSSVVPIITDWLRDLYEKAFTSGKQRERELRGETRQVPRPSDFASVPTNTSGQDGLDNPLGRKEVREALDDGKTLQDVLGTDGALSDLRDAYDSSKADVSSSFASVEDEADDLTGDDND